MRHVFRRGALSAVDALDQRFQVGSFSLKHSLLVGGDLLQGAEAQQTRLRRLFRLLGGDKGPGFAHQRVFGIVRYLRLLLHQGLRLLDSAAPDRLLGSQRPDLRFDVRDLLRELFLRAVKQRLRHADGTALVAVPLLLERSQRVVQHRLHHADDLARDRRLVQAGGCLAHLLRQRVHAGLLLRGGHLGGRGSLHRRHGRNTLRRNAAGRCCWGSKAA
mmetsp:Transcript_36270/g.104325  ORF Transcript_36270/g.104325 Transcript_36270/m.104325 type:complete len:217 (-) Transcript_36270:2-652(-)